MPVSGSRIVSVCSSASILVRTSDRLLERSRIQGSSRLDIFARGFSRTREASPALDAARADRLTVSLLLTRGRPALRLVREIGRPWIFESMTKQSVNGSSMTSLSFFSFEVSGNFAVIFVFMEEGTIVYTYQRDLSHSRIKRPLWRLRRAARRRTVLHRLICARDPRVVTLIWHGTGRSSGGLIGIPLSCVINTDSGGKSNLLLDGYPHCVPTISTNS